MIHIEVLESPDKNVLTDFKFHQNEIYIGYSFGNLCIDDPKIHRSHLMIEVVESELIVHPQKNVEAYLIDGKRATSIRKIKSGQIIAIGSTKIKILSFEQSLLKPKKEILDDKLSKLIENHSSRLSVIEKIATIMK